MKFDEKMRQLRKQSGLSQEQLAEKLQVSRQAVSKWESGSAYPEMDKLLELCKVFGCTLEELTSDEVDMENINAGKSKNIINEYVNQVTSFIKKSIDMFLNMSLMQYVKMFIIMFIVVLVTKLITVPLDDLVEYSKPLFTSFGDIFSPILYGLWYFIISLLKAGVSIFLFIYVYKIVFLDKYEYIDKTVENTNSTNNETATEQNKKENSKTLEPVAIRNEHSVAHVIWKTIMVGIKCLAFFIAIPFLLASIGCGLAMTLLVWICFQGIVLAGPICIVVFGFLLLIMILEILFNFVFEKKTNVKKLFVELIIGIAGIGVGLGLSFIRASEITYVDEIPGGYTTNVSTKEFVYNERLSINIHNTTDKVEYVTTDELNNNFKIEITYYDKISKPIFMTNENSIIVYSGDDEFSFEVIEGLIDNLKDNKFYNYNRLSEYKVKIYASEDIIEKLKLQVN